MARLPLPDILQRGITYSLAGLTVYGLIVGVAVHRDTLRRGRGESWLHANLSVVLTKAVPFDMRRSKLITTPDLILTDAM